MSLFEEPANDTIQKQPQQNKCNVHYDLFVSCGSGYQLQPMKGKPVGGNGGVRGRRAIWISLATLSQ